MFTVREHTNIMNISGFFTPSHLINI